MQELAHQLGELFLQAVPTVLIVFLFYLFLRANFFRPLERVLEERRARTEGARRAAESAQAAAQEKERAHQEALRKAKAELYAEQEQARRRALDERAEVIRSTRARAGDDIRMAKAKIQAEAAAARKELEQATQVLAAEISRAILGRRPPRTQSPREAR
jgi:F-type H+-transporting ATPase subunit b